MSKDLILGLDCGATKVLSQFAYFDPDLGLVVPDGKSNEVLYSEDQDWNNNFKPVTISHQKKEFEKNNIKLLKSENDQGLVIIKTIKKVVDKFNHIKSSICYPGVKNNDGVIIMANGPRIPKLRVELNHFKKIYNDSDCCILGEWKSSVGSMIDVQNGLYIGGGTGIADGIINKSKLINFNRTKGLKRSWELFHNEISIEQLLSPRGLIVNYNNKFNERINSLNDLVQSEHCFEILEGAVEALSVLIKNRVEFFNKNKTNLDLVVIGQRLGLFLSNQNNQIQEMFKSCTEVPIKFSHDRRTASLGAIYSLSYF